MGSNPSHFIGDLKRPVGYITWNDCQTFITKLNQMAGRQFRLPIEAEWELAARGGRYDVVSKYSGNDDPHEVAWFYFNSESATHPVWQKGPNELGIYDMSGNVYEFCQDWYGDLVVRRRPILKGRQQVNTALCVVAIGVPRQKAVVYHIGMECIQQWWTVP